jgi:hypothetical protein
MDLALETMGYPGMTVECTKWSDSVQYSEDHYFPNQIQLWD